MPKSKDSLVERAVTIIGKPSFVRIILAVLIIQAGWLALSGRYPMAFDEDFHLGIIRLYAHHLSPFWSGQPPGADQFGAVARDPSYLYQYLMSFPYRLVSALTGDQTIQVLLLRAINIGLFSWGILLYRRLMLKAKAPSALVHTCLLILVLIPVVPLLAAQINYDNLFVPLTAAALLLTLQLNEQLTKHRRLDAKTLAQLLVICFLSCLVKYAFLPVFMIIGAFVLIRVWQLRRSLSGRRLGIVSSWQQLGKATQLGVVVSVILAAGLFGERYVVNLVHYHTPVPDCSNVLSIKQCSRYGPWIRDYDFKINKLDSDAKRSPLSFTANWMYGMWLRLFFAVDGPATDFETRGPFIVPALTAIVFSVAGAAAILIKAPSLLRKYSNATTWLFVAVTVSYTSVLWLDEYQAFLETGQPVAINGRYLLPVLPLAFLIAAMAIAELVRRRSTKLVVACAAIICLAWGGGALTYVLRSNNVWYWPNSTVKTVNHAVQRTLGPLTPSYYQPTLFLH